MAEVTIDIIANDKATATFTAVLKTTEAMAATVRESFSRLDEEFDSLFSTYQAEADKSFLYFPVGLDDDNLDDEFDALYSTYQAVAEKSSLYFPMGLDDDNLDDEFDTLYSSYQAVADKSSLDFPVSLNTSAAMKAVVSLTAAVDNIPTQKALNLDVSQALSGAASAKAAIDAIPDVSYKTVIVNYVGKGSSQRPIMDKLKEIKSAQAGLSGEGQYKVSFQGGGRGIPTAPISNAMDRFTGNNNSGGGGAPILYIGNLNHTSTPGGQDAETILKEIADRVRRGTDPVTPEIKRRLKIA